MHKIVIVIVLILMILLFMISRHPRKCNCGQEHLMSPGYANRQEVSVNLDKTYGGTDSQFSKDPRFAV